MRGMGCEHTRYLAWHHSYGAHILRAQRADFPNFESKVNSQRAAALIPCTPADSVFLGVVMRLARIKSTPPNATPPHPQRQTQNKYGTLQLPLANWILGLGVFG